MSDYDPGAVNRLRALRERAGDSASDAARRVHVTDRAWRRWEDGTRAAPEAVVHLYCLVTGQTYPDDEG